MFHSSKQRNMLFKSESDIQEIRNKVNQNFRDSNQECSEFFISPEDERLLCRKFERELLRFCNVFEEPPLFRSIKCTAMNFLKRFYLKHSAMEFYPQNVMLLCVYFACKVDEYTIGIDKFVSMLEESLQFETGSFILGNEFLLMEALDYSLTVYNSYRPLDGFLIELEHKLSKESADCLKSHALSFINDAILTDATLIYSPSQIALSSLVYSSEQNKVEIGGYIKSLTPDTVTHNKLIATVTKIRQHLQLNYKFQISSSKLKELEAKCGAISKSLEIDGDEGSSADERQQQQQQQGERISKRRKTLEEMETELLS
ncbi:cyclin-H-like [Bolinopsis microptera]|uniref:cyclin-H-like n=1 Tax=Bolinopsis microptera TaxID=2820187 RepID=UPI003079D5B3